MMMRDPGPHTAGPSQTHLPASWEILQVEEEHGRNTGGTQAPGGISTRDTTLEDLV